MTPTDIIVIGIILLVIGASAFYIIKSKRMGKKCIGCPYSTSCSSSGACAGKCLSDAQCSEHEPDSQSS